MPVLSAPDAPEELGNTRGSKGPLEEKEFAREITRYYHDEAVLLEECRGGVGGGEGWRNILSERARAKGKPHTRTHGLLTLKTKPQDYSVFRFPAQTP